MVGIYTIAGGPANANNAGGKLAVRGKREAVLVTRPHDGVSISDEARQASEAAQALVTAFSGHHHVFGDTMRELTARFALRRLRGMLEQKAESLSEYGDEETQKWKDEEKCVIVGAVGEG